MEEKDFILIKGIIAGSDITIHEKQSIEKLLQAYQEDETVIDSMTEFLEDLKLSKDREGYEVMNKADWKQYFRKKVKDE